MLNREITRVSGLLGDPIWSPDDRYIAFQNAPDIHMINVETGKISNATRIEKNNRRYFDYNKTSPYWNGPDWSPDGEYILCTLYTGTSDLIGKLYAISIKTKEKIYLTEGHDGDWIQ